MRNLLATAAFLACASTASADAIAYAKLGELHEVACVVTVAEHEEGWAGQVYMPGHGFGPWVGNYLGYEDAINEAVAYTEKLFGASC